VRFTGQVTLIYKGGNMVAKRKLFKQARNTVVRNVFGCYVADVYFDLAKNKWILDDLRGGLEEYTTRMEAEQAAKVMVKN